MGDAPVRKDDALEAWVMTDPDICDAVRGCDGDIMYDNNNHDKDNDHSDARGGSLPDSSTAIIPVGALEQHGPHLPVSTDSIIASEVARIISKECGYLLLPAISYGVSHEHAPLFHASVDADSLRASLCGLRDSLGSYGVRHVIVVNGHHGNIDALDGLDADAQIDEASVVDAAGDITDTGTIINNSAVQMHVFHYWRHMQHDLGHAGFAETSMMLAISPELVRMSLAQKGLVTDDMPDDEIRRLSDLAKESFLGATGNGIWGDPTGATAHAGRRMLDAAAGDIALVCRRVCSM